MFLLCPQKGSFQMYERYCQNKLRSEALWRQFSDCAFFQVNVTNFDTFVFFCTLKVKHWFVLKNQDLQFASTCLLNAGVSEEAGAQTGPGFLPVETGSTSHQIPAAAQG